MRLMFVVAACVSIGGCATTEKVWNKPASSQQEFYIDSSQCRAQAASVPMASMLQIAIVYNGCMGGKGWYLEDVQKR
jgi:hypothetical protein